MVCIKIACLCASIFWLALIVPRTVFAKDNSSTQTESPFTISRRFIPHVLNFDDKHLEANWKPTEQSLEFDPSLCALILVDVWNTNEISFERIDKITRTQIQPIVKACRKAGFLVIHAPGPPVADKYPSFRFYKPQLASPVDAKRSDSANHHQVLEWPTSEMLAKTGRFSAYSLRMQTDQSHAPLSEAELYHNYQIHPAISPDANDFVIRDKSELHALLRDRKRFHLFYVGFAANGCLQERDYGVKSMNGLGYDVTLLRECTTATETATSLPTLEQTRASIENMEFWISTASSADFLNALRPTTEVAPDGTKKQ